MGTASRIALGGLVLGAAVLRAVHLNWGLPEVFEEAIPVREAIALWGTPGTGLTLNPHFFKYPSLTIYLNFALQSVWYLWLSLSGAVASLNEFRQVLEQDFAQAILWGRALQVGLGALTVIPVWHLGHRLVGTRTAWFAAGLAAVLPVMVMESQSVGPDVALAFFASWALVTSLSIVDHGSRRAYLATGLWIGLAAASKYPGAFLLVALGVAHAVRMIEARRGPGAILLSSFLGQAVVTAGVVFLLATPYVLIDAPTAAADIRFEQQHMNLGHLGREEGRAWIYYLVHAIPEGWSPGVSVLALAGVIGLALRAPTRKRLWPGLAFAAVMLLVLGSWKMAAPRYLLPLAPLAVVWAAAAVDGILTRIPGGGRGPAPAILAGVLLILWPLSLSARQVGFRGRPDSRQAAEAWIVEHLPEGSSLLLERYGPEPDPERYLLLWIPFHSVTPHLYDGAYRLDLYTTFEYVVCSSGVSSRYLAAPREYPAQVSFYAALDRWYRPEVTFPTGAYSGPEIRILKRRPQTPVPAVDRIPDSYFATQRGNGPLAEFLSALGTVLVRQGIEESGFRLLQEAVDMDPESERTWGNLGVMRLRKAQFEGALTALRRAQELAPEDPDLWLNLGTLYTRMGEPRQAADAFRHAIRYGPDREDAFLGLARSLIEDDQYAEARLVLNEFLVRFPRSPRLDQARAALRQLAGMGPGRP